MSRPGDPVRVLAIHRYYWPDTPPYASILRAVVHHWRLGGAETEVFSSQPSYKADVTLNTRPRWERVDGTPVRRVRLPRGRRWIVKAVNAALFTIAATLHVLRARRDVVMCSTSPPVVLGAFVSLATQLRGGSFVYHCMDLHPEIGALSGDFSRPLVYRLLMWLERGACRRAAAIVVLSQDMRRAVLERDPALSNRIVVLNNPDLPEFGDPSETVALPRKDSRLRLVFAGNLGRFQGLEMVVDGLSSLADEADLELVLMGDGTARRDLVRRAEGLSADARTAVTWVPHGSSAQARALMRTADVGLVTLRPGIIKYAFPSKTMTYFSEGLPALVGVEPDSELARTVEHEGIGFVLAFTDAAAVRCALTGLIQRRDELEEMGRRALAYAAREAGQEAVLRRWEALLRDVITAREGLA